MVLVGQVPATFTARQSGVGKMRTAGPIRRPVTAAKSRS
jgi:hypothetical protein